MMTTNSAEISIGFSICDDRLYVSVQHRSADGVVRVLASPQVPLDKLRAKDYGITLELNDEQVVRAEKAEDSERMALASVTMKQASETLRLCTVALDKSYEEVEDLKAQLAEVKEEAARHRVMLDAAAAGRDDAWAKVIVSRQQHEDTVQLVGVKDGVETVLGTATMPPKMKARELVREVFGDWQDDDGSIPELSFAVCEQLIDWMQKTPLVINTEGKA